MTGSYEPGLDLEEEIRYLPQIPLACCLVSTSAICSSLWAKTSASFWSAYSSHSATGGGGGVLPGDDLPDLGNSPIGGNSPGSVLGGESRRTRLLNTLNEAFICSVTEIILRIAASCSFIVAERSAIFPNTSEDFLRFWFSPHSCTSRKENPAIRRTPRTPAMIPVRICMSILLLFRFGG